MSPCPYFTSDYMENSRYKDACQFKDSNVTVTHFILCFVQQLMYVLAISMWIVLGLKAHR